MTAGRGTVRRGTGQTVAVFAHFDPGGQVADHVRHYLAQVAECADRVLVVSTADPTPAARRVLAEAGELVVRENVGYDFYSWKTGIDRLGDLRQYERLLLCNDSVVGPVVPLRTVLGRPPAADLWSMTASAELEPHLQSWFAVYEHAALRSGFVQAFWQVMTPESHRYQVIRRYEIGLSRLVRTAGLRTASWFVPDRRETLRAQARWVDWLATRPPRAGGPVARPGTRKRLTSTLAVLRGTAGLQPWNPAYLCWDATLSGRLPFAKLETLRDSPMGLDSEHVLTRLEQAFPVPFAGVRDYLERTRADMRRLRRVS